MINSKKESQQQILKKTYSERLISLNHYENIAKKRLSAIYVNFSGHFKRSFLIAAYFNTLFPPTLLSLLPEAMKMATGKTFGPFAIAFPLLNIVVIPALFAMLDALLKKHCDYTIVPKLDVYDRIPWLIALPFVEKKSHGIIGNALSLTRIELMSLLTFGGALQLMQMILHVALSNRVTFLDTLYNNAFFAFVGQFFLFGKLLPKLFALTAWGKTKTRRFNRWWDQSFAQKNKAFYFKEQNEYFQSINELNIYADSAKSLLVNIYQDPWDRFKRTFLIAAYFTVLLVPTLFSVSSHMMAPITSPILFNLAIPTIVAAFEWWLKKFYDITLMPKPDAHNRIPWLPMLLFDNALSLTRTEVMSLLVVSSILQLTQMILRVAHPNNVTFLDNLYSNAFFTFMGQFLLFGKFFPKLFSVLFNALPKSTTTWTTKKINEFDRWVRNSWNQKNKAPLGQQLSTDIFRIVSLSTSVGYWVGMGVAVIRKILIGDDMPGIFYSAIGALVFGVLGALSPIVDSSLNCFRNSLRRQQKNKINHAQIKITVHRSLQRQRSDFFGNLFLAAQMGAVLTGIIVMNIEGEIGKNVGLGIGALMGVTMITLRLLPILLRGIGHVIHYFVKQFFNKDLSAIVKTIKISEKNHYSYFARLFFGLWAGYIGTGLMNSLHAQLLASTIIGGVAFLSPVLFLIFRNIANKCGFKQKEYDPWYVRLFAGVVAGATISLVAQANPVWLYIIGAFSLFWPIFSKLLDRVFQCCHADFARQFLKKSSPLRSWYARIAFGALTGAMFGYVVAAMKITNQYKAPSSRLPFIFMWITLTLALITPAVKTGLAYCGFKHKIFNPTHETKDDLNWPWYTRTLAGLWSGALVGGAIHCALFGYKWIPGDIAPDFLNIDNQYGAPTGALVFFIVAVLWPFAQFGWQRAKNTMSDAGLFQQRAQDKPKFVEDNNVNGEVSGVINVDY